MFLEVSGSRDNSHAYIAKGPRVHGVRECVTEAMISSIGRLLPVRLARFRLSQVHGSKSQRSSSIGALGVRFMSRYFLRKPTESLFHGDELVALWLGADEGEIKETFAADKVSERLFYTVDLLLEVLDAVCLESEYCRVRDGLGRMLAFDAIVGTNDRHPRNWGVISDGVSVGDSLRFAPLFDSARGLFWNFSDKQLHARVEGGSSARSAFVEKYANGSNPLISCRSHPHPDKVNHFSLVEYMLQACDGQFADSVPRVVRSFSARRTRSALAKEYGGIVSSFRLGLVGELLEYRIGRLLDVVGGRRQ
ncbi:MAG: hypothetical protein H6706_16040 [Myxococcales bacterium]|nr:hypothetical protein [Myxococcales bacterium]